MTRPTGSQATSGVAEAGRPRDAPAVVLGSAEWAVRVALTASDQESAGSALASPAMRSRTVSGSVRVLSASSVAAEQVGEDYWRVTVAVELMLGSTDVVRWFFEIGVVETPGGAFAVSDPGLVAAPPSPKGRVEVAAGTLRSPDLSDPATDTVSSFLTALLTGDQAVGRWTAPGFETGPAVAIGAFDDIRVDRVSIDEADDGSRRVRAEITAMSPDDVALVLTYEVVIVSRGGRWEVTSVSGAPSIASFDTGSAETPSPPTPTSTSTSTTAPAASPTADSTVQIAPAEGTNNNNNNPYLYEEEES
ncbi:MAG: conjugal transfer protein [Acidimicrobiales bacterium]|nr:conjugal transfer protein [Acidimicrobiales bacterium]